VNHLGCLCFAGVAGTTGRGAGSAISEAVALARSCMTALRWERTTRMTVHLPDTSMPCGRGARRRVHEEYLLWLTAMGMHGMPQPAPKPSGHIRRLVSPGRGARRGLALASTMLRGNRASRRPHRQRLDTRPPTAPGQLRLRSLEQLAVLPQRKSRYRTAREVTVHTLLAPPTRNRSGVRRKETRRLSQSGRLNPLSL
jgi:hypothetical protein